MFVKLNLSNYYNTFYLCTHYANIILVPAHNLTHQFRPMVPALIIGFECYPSSCCCSNCMDNDSFKGSTWFSKPWVCGTPCCSSRIFDTSRRKFVCQPAFLKKTKISLQALQKNRMTHRLGIHGEVEKFTAQRW